MAARGRGLKDLDNFVRIFAGTELDGGPVKVVIRQKLIAFAVNLATKIIDQHTFFSVSKVAIQSNF